MTHFLAIEINQRYDAIRLWFVIMLAILVAWSPKSWSGCELWNHLFVTIFQSSTCIFEWLVTHSFSNSIFFHGNGFFFGSSFLDEGGLN